MSSFSPFAGLRPIDTIDDVGVGHARNGHVRQGYVGRYAPSPSGELHLGNALTALVAFLRAKACGGRLLLRIEDLDTPRVVDGADVRLQQDLADLGITFDGEVVRQSQRLAHYQAALDALDARGLLYGCSCSRKALASAPHAGEDGPPYPGTCRDSLAQPRLAQPLALRLRVPDACVEVKDALAGTIRRDLVRDDGDYIVKRKDGIIAYQLAVVVDDAAFGVTEVVRGADLFHVAPRQVSLFLALGFCPPRYAHVPLLCDDTGAKISKRDGQSAHLLRNTIAKDGAGHVRAWLAQRLGLRVNASASIADLIDAYATRCPEDEELLEGAGGPDDAETTPRRR